LKSFSKTDLIDCCNGKEIDPFVVYPNTSYDFDSTHFENLEQLEKILSKNKKLLQKIRKKWTSGHGQQETINIYATPVYGKFCSSDFHEIGKKRTGYEGKVYIPISSFSAYSEFWIFPAAKFILGQAFSNLNYKISSY